ncbi:MAG: hypothetical protein ABI230_01630 [Aestuariivirga sp.]
MTSIMRKFCMWKISLVAAVGIFTGSALAVSTPAEQAVALLARSQVVNATCNYLNAVNKTRLAQLVQQAEVALTARENAKAAEAAMRRGNDDGLAAACSAAERAKLNSTFAAASQAASHAVDNFGTDKPMIAAAPKPMPAFVKKQVTEPSSTIAIARPPSHVPPQSRPDDNGLLYYAQITGDYFIARRCSPGDTRGLGKMSQEILVTRNDLMRNHSASKLLVVLHRAERAALVRSCG